jgi:hypothetical protein
MKIKEKKGTIDIRGEMLLKIQEKKEKQTR